MCGIFGVAGYIGTEALDVLVNLAVLNQSRGTHSSGVAAYVFEDNGYMIKKKAIPAGRLVRSQEYEDFQDFIFGKWAIVLGHTRWATMGAITDRNAHPFEIDNLIGIHNGIITNHRELARELKFNYEVDSEAIFHVLAKLGPDHLNRLDGGMAISWIDKKAPTRLNLFKSGNPISLIYFGAERLMVFSSQSNHLSEATRSARLSGGQDILLKEDKVYKIDVLTFGDKAEKIEASMTDVPPLPRTYGNYYGRGGGRVVPISVHPSYESRTYNIDVNDMTEDERYEPAGECWSCLDPVLKEDAVKFEGEIICSECYSYMRDVPSEAAVKNMEAEVVDEVEVIEELPTEIKEAVAEAVEAVAVPA